MDLKFCLQVKSIKIKWTFFLQKIWKSKIIYLKVYWFNENEEQFESLIWRLHTKQKRWGVKN